MKKSFLITILLILLFTLSAKADFNNNYYKGELFNKMGFTEQAEEYYQTSFDEQSVIRLAQIYLNQEENKKAKEILLKKIKAEEEKEVSSYLYFWLARAYFQNNEYEKAKTEIDRFITRVPDSVNGFIVKGDIFSAQDKTDLARANYKKAVNLKPDYSLAKYRLWGISEEISLRELAEQLKEKPGDSRTRNIMADQLKRRDQQDISQMQRMLANGGNKNLKQYGSELLKAGKLKEAEYMYLSYLNNYPKDSEALASLCRIYLAEGKISRVQSLLETYPDFESLRLIKALVARTQGNPSSAVYYYWSYLNNNGDSADGYVGVAYTYLQLGRYELAERDFKSALFLAPDYKDAYTGICNALAAQNKYEDILYWTSRAMNKFPEEFEFLFRRAEAFYQLKEYNPAKNILSSKIPDDYKNRKEGFKLLAALNYKTDDLKASILNLKEIEDDKENLSLTSYYQVLYILYNRLELNYHSKKIKEELKLREIKIPDSKSKEDIVKLIETI